MPKNREKQRVNRRKESLLDSKNEFGITDPTPKQAVKKLIKNSKMTAVC
ncbi:hypothetical protein [Desulfosporosinus sp.]|nr:hypothetical protein [Desulfosporosinus sp.]MCO5384437.1 hypothetical protein [Desulfosporosinus sp.]